MTLTPKQKLFIREYLKDFNATKAAIRAGYSEDSAPEIGCENLRKPNIKQAIDKYLDDVHLTTQRIALELANIAFSDMADYATVEPGGSITLKPFEDMQPGATKVIKKLKEKRRVLSGSKPDEEDNGSTIIDSQIEFELHDKLGALEKAGKYRGMFKDNLNLNTNGGLKIIAIRGADEPSI
jgi:phage terminase small subunit